MAESVINTEQAFESTIKIADEVITSIAELAAADVDGVAGIAGNAGGRVRDMLGGRAARKGVKAVIDNDDVKLTLSLTVRYGSNIPSLSRAVQEKVAGAVSNMTGFTVSEVNINITGITMPEN